MSVAQLFRDGANIDRHAVAIEGDGRAATSAQLDEASNRVANAVIAAGVARGDRVGFVDRNGTPYWECFLGALKTDTVLVPLNFRLSAEELAWSKRRAGVCLVVAGAPYGPLIRPVGRPLVVIGGDRSTLSGGSGVLDYDDWLASAAAGDPGRDAVGSELIELICSSGTTGRPKGVLVSTEQEVWSVDAFGSCFDVDSSSRSLVPVLYYHVAGGGWALITLAKGVGIIQSREPTAASMLDQLLTFRATHTAMVPAVMQILTASPAARSADFSALRQVVYGGSPITEPLLLASARTFGADLVQS